MTVKMEAALAWRQPVKARNSQITGRSPVVARTSGTVTRWHSTLQPSCAPSAMPAPSVAFWCTAGLVTASVVTSVRCSCRGLSSRAPCAGAGSSVSCATSTPDPSDGLWSGAHAPVRLFVEKRKNIQLIHVCHGKLIKCTAHLDEKKTKKQSK